MDNVNIIATAKSWIEGEAIRQLENTARLPGMVNITGLPDLHPGRGTPIGAVFESKDMIYPHLVGNDIGCGMMFMQADIKLQKFKLDKVVRKIPDLQAPMGDEGAAIGHIPYTIACVHRNTFRAGGIRVLFSVCIHVIPCAMNNPQNLYPLNLVKRPEK